MVEYRTSVHILCSYSRKSSDPDDHPRLLKAAELTAPLAFTTESVGILEELGERLMSPMPGQR
jgi:hypothetical protein